MEFYYTIEVFNMIKYFLSVFCAWVKYWLEFLKSFHNHIATQASL